MAILGSAVAVSASGAPSWEAVTQHGDVPPPLWEAGASFARVGGVDSSVVYRFGGQLGSFPTDFTRNDFYALDLDTATWTDLGSPETPGPRADPAMMAGPCGNCVSVFGGRGRFRTGMDHMFPEMWTYHTAADLWQQVPPEDLGDPFAIRRSSALVVAVPAGPQGSTYYTFGGVGNTLPSFPTTPTGLRSDVAVYDRDGGWSEVVTLGDQPAPRAWPGGAYDPVNHSILVFGGYRLGPDQGPETPPFLLFGPTNYENDLWSLDLETNLWTELEPAGTLPTPRDNVPSFFDASRGGLVIVGGQPFDGPVMDLWIYSIADNEWSEVALAPGSPVPPPRVGAVYVVRETDTTYELFLHSGSSSDGGGGAVFYNDLWKLTWPKE